MRLYKAIIKGKDDMYIVSQDIVSASDSAAKYFLKSEIFSVSLVSDRVVVDGLPLNHKMVSEDEHS